MFYIRRISDDKYWRGQDGKSYWFARRSLADSFYDERSAWVAVFYYGLSAVEVTEVKQRNRKGV